MNNPYTRLSLLCLLTLLLISCSSTKKIDNTDILKSPEDAKSEATKYPSDVAGTVEDLYGENAFESNELYTDAIKENPVLQYNIVYFSFDQTELSAKAKDLISQHANYLKENLNVFVMLEGHTDTQGSEGYNLALGERRAKTVRNLMVFYGVNQNQISTISFGEEKPAVLGQDEESYAKNRRVEIIYQ